MALPETTELLSHQFDHIFYTGNGAVGRVVMEAAAKHLTPVTLELGGKSPAIVTDSADLAVSARRVAWGKYVNAGQTCVAPDYVLVHEASHDAFVEELGKAVRTFFGDDPAQSPDYGRIVNERHHARLTALIDGGGYEAIALGGGHDRDQRYLAPTVLTGVKPDAAVMEGEIFGPILPVLSYDTLDDAIAFVNERPKPLALYVFASQGTTIDRVLERTSAGGVTVNHTLMHVAVPELPFGGVGAEWDRRIPRRGGFQGVLALQVGAATIDQTRSEHRLSALHELQAEGAAQAAVTGLTERSTAGHRSRPASTAAGDLPHGAPQGRCARRGLASMSRRRCAARRSDA